MLSKRLTIKEFDTAHEPAYKIIFENINPAFSLFVYRNEGSILFGKSSISSSVIDGFELKPNNDTVELLLHITDNFGSHTYLIGKIDDKDEGIKADGEAWIIQVNQLYENHRKRQTEVEAAG